MKVYVAFRTDVDPPPRLASPSFTKLKKQMVITKNADYTVALYDIKPNVENLCKAIVDVTDLDAEEAMYFHVNEQGHLRSVEG